LGVLQRSHIIKTDDDENTENNKSKLNNASSNTITIGAIFLA
jgi:hypothetical protein